MEKNESADLSDIGWLKLIMPPSYVHSSVTGAAPSSSPKAVMSMDDVMEDGSAPRRMIMVLRVTPVVALTGAVSASMMHITSQGSWKTLLLFVVCCGIVGRKVQDKSWKHVVNQTTRYDTLVYGSMNQARHRFELVEVSYDTYDFLSFSSSVRTLL